MVFVIARPRPTPPTFRVLFGSKRANRSKTCVSSSAEIPEPESDTVRWTLSPVATGAQLDAVTYVGVIDGVFDQRIQWSGQAFHVSLNRGFFEHTNRPSSRHVAPTTETVEQSSLTSTGA